MADRVVAIDTPYLNARQAAAYVGYEPNGGPASQDKALRAFYEFVRRHKVTRKHRGRRLLFLRKDLDRAIDTSTDAYATKLDQMEALAHAHARGG